MENDPSPDLIGSQTLDFLEKLGSGASVPGGGGASALVGAISASLVSMVANLTLGKPGYEDFQEDFRDSLSRSKSLTHRLVEYVDEDAKAFKELMAAYRQKGNSEDHSSNFRIQSAAKDATDVPLKISYRCLEVMELSLHSVKFGNKNAITDAGAAAYMAKAALQSALLNVDINLPSVVNEQYGHDRRRRSCWLQDRAEEIETKVKDCLRSRLES